MSNNSAVYSTMVRAGKTTYFIDVKEARNGNKFIAISESRVDMEDKKQRSTIRVFGDTIQQFKQAIDEAASAASQ